jgi:hypothetical protein
MYIAWSNRAGIGVLLTNVNGFALSRMTSDGALQTFITWVCVIHQNFIGDLDTRRQLGCRHSAPFFAQHFTSVLAERRLLFTHIYDMKIVNVTICGYILNVVSSVQESPNFAETNHPFGR